MDYAVITVYLIMLLIMGQTFKRFNRNNNDFIRCGGQGTWWLVGTSCLMGSISAFTFTGNAGAMFKAGWTPLIIFFANTAALLVSAIYLAAWFRQTRAHTVPDIYKARFGPEVEQFTSYLGMVMGSISAAMWLWGLATFSSAMFSVRIEFLIWGIGFVTVFYSMAGGRWAVMATDFLQSLILFPITIVLAGLCLWQVGGIGEFLAATQTEALASDFRWVKDAGDFPANAFTWEWIVAILIMNFISGLGLHNAGRYLSVKDGTEARKASLLAAALMLFGCLIWFIPPVVARILYADEVMAIGLNNPEEAAYAMIAAKLLPNGLMSIMIVAMFAATMSSMDTGLNGSAGIFMRNVLPPLRRCLRLPEYSETAALKVSRAATVALGLCIILLAQYFAIHAGLGLFDMMLKVVSIFAMPTIIPMIYAIFIRRLPRWSFFFSSGCAAIPVAISIYSEIFLNQPWTFQSRTIALFICGSIGIFASIPFYKSDRWTSPAYRAKVDAFFTLTRTPIDYKREIGVSNDNQQLRILGSFSIIIGCFIMALLLLPNPFWHRMCILFIAASAIAMGAFMRVLEKKRN